ncbi:type I toxin-antitoxin system toxin IbsC [Escherichia coli]|nr:type I toxin-antitoxin system toxin IbsC [Escherichia coli]EFK6979994.1 type I toxin-antitoxin system toxin IbsC [Escherichia coli]EFK7427875.1 type I toxin-antitoxin system toxin IbsC [Escherichia coli]MCQ1610741.1 type I toxin-antitoxin system toxin IbsC [Escherichia coli]HBU4743246.1 type I toxin-antitoxin system toxin IbsC [Escherichia coli]
MMRLAIILIVLLLISFSAY